MPAPLYVEVREAVGRLFAAGAPDPLATFGLADLLASSDAAERSAAFAVAEAQGRAGATTGVVSAIALAGLDVPPACSYGLRLVSGTTQSPALYGLLGSAGPVDVLVTDGDQPAWLDEQTSVLRPSPQDPGYLMVVETGPGSRRPADVANGAGVESRARMACAAEALGACEAMLADAIEYASARKQFGAPLASFQAVAHALAWAATEVHQLRALLDVSLAADAVSTPDPALAMAMKSLAGRVSRRVAQHTLQVTGGMGFTWEYSHNALHRRVLTLDAVAGSAETLNRELGEWLRAGAGIDPSYPALISLEGLADARLSGPAAGRS